MNHSLTILVVGAGRFGGNYLKALAALGRRMPGDMPPIGTVVVTRTTRSAAEETAAQWRRQSPAPAFVVIGAEVGGEDQLAAILDRYRPHLTCITARDPQSGDDIHCRYAAVALDAGAVLSEKNFAPTVGDGASLATVARLSAHPNAGRLGLELPLVPLRAAMAPRPDIARALAVAEDIRFQWEVPDTRNAGIIAEAALHPWSLIPASWRIEVARVTSGDGRADIDLFLQPPGTDPVKACNIALRIGGRLRAMHIGDMGLKFTYGEGYLKAIPLAATGAPVDARPRALCRSSNPIRQHILALLRGTPLVGIEEIRRSQLFLEQLAGYSPENSGEKPIAKG